MADARGVHDSAPGRLGYNPQTPAHGPKSQMEPDTPVSIVILTHNNLSYTQECLAALEENTKDHEVVVVDNASTDGTVEFLQGLEKRQPNAKVILSETNTGFAAGCNLGVAAATHEAICLLNNDTVPLPGWLDALRASREPGMGAVGAKLLFPDMTLQHCGIAFDRREQPTPHYWPYHRFFDYPEEIEEANVAGVVPAVTAACLLTDKTVWDEVEGMDEGYLVANFEDVDFNLKVRNAGHRVFYEPAARVIHYWGKTVTTKGEEAPDSPAHHFQHNFDRLQRKWFEHLARGMADA